MPEKNTIVVRAPSLQEFTFHLIERVSMIEVQIYPFGDPKRKETIGYYSKTYKTFDAVGPRYVYEYAKHVAKSILNKEYDDTYKSLFFKQMQITPVGKQTILRRAFTKCDSRN